MIRARNLTHRFGEQTILEGISFDIAKGQAVAIMGSSGGGKTTLLRCLSGLLEPTEGTVELFERDFYRLREREKEQIRRRIGVVFQGAALFDYMSVRDNIIFGAVRQKRLSKQEVDDLVRSKLDMVGLDGASDKFPGELSGGMKKRVGLARALASDPEILFYDEPTSGLDPVIAFSIDGLIVEVAEKLGATSIIVTHDINAMLRTAERVMFLDAGRIRADTTPAAFMELDDPVVRELIEKARTQSVEA